MVARPAEAGKPAEQLQKRQKVMQDMVSGDRPSTGVGRLYWGVFIVCAATMLPAMGADAAEVTPPADIAQAGKIIYCSDISGPPLGYFDENNKPIGSDIDLGTEIAKRLGVAVEFANTPFDGIVPALQAKHCDAILSQLFDKPKRREVVDFIDYMYSSESLLVHKGNPKNIHSLDDLSGVKIAVEIGTTIQTLIDEQNKKFAAAGKPPANVVVYPKDSDALQALQINQVDVYGTTLESAAYFMQKASNVFDVGGEPFAKILTGIAVRKDDHELRDAIQKAFDNMKADGTYMQILTKWHLEGDKL
jgi:polar amino acid transport system substrate-binding protein